MGEGGGVGRGASRIHMVGWVCPVIPVTTLHAHKYVASPAPDLNCFRNKVFN